MTLTQIATAAVRLVNKENDIKLKKVAEFGNAELGAVVYKDTEWSEYRILYFAEKEHLKLADGNFPLDADGKADALKAGEQYAAGDMQLKTPVETPVIEPDPEPAAKVEAEDTKPVRRARPRGYYAQPSGLLAGMFQRASLIK